MAAPRDIVMAYIAMADGCPAAVPVPAPRQFAVGHAPEKRKAVALASLYLVQQVCVQDRCGPMWTDVDRCGQMWTDVDRCGPIRDIYAETNVLTFVWTRASTFFADT